LDIQQQRALARYLGGAVLRSNRARKRGDKTETYYRDDVAHD
jgi:hypothetical protein